jgi:uracil-DNA glycosylase
MSAFWSIDHVELSDTVNDRIWSDSPHEQATIQQPGSLQSPGSIGAQQIMVDGLATSLPWLPDLVGLNWKRPESLIIIGSAYAPFIRGISKRRYTLPLSEYLDARCADDFLIRFLENVVIPDPSYYAKIELLAASQENQAGIVLLDLCRASYTFRGSRIGKNGLDRAAEFTFRDTIKGQKNAAAAVRSRQLFTAYVESKQQRAWTLARLMESRARRIVALGSIAEHGLLKLLWDCGVRTIHRMSTPGEAWHPNPDHSGRWVLQYACKGQTLEQWLVRKDWWVVKGRLNGEEREWHLLPTMHPAARNAKDKDYSRTRALITRM